MQQPLTEQLDAMIAALLNAADESLVEEHRLTTPLPSRASSSQDRSRHQPYPVDLGTAAALKGTKQRLLEEVERQMDALRPVLGKEIGELRDQVTRASECCICKDSVPRLLFVRPCHHSACAPCIERLGRTKNKEGKLVKYSNKCPICRVDFATSPSIANSRSVVSAQRFPVAEEALHDLSAVFAETVKIDKKWLEK